MKITGYLHLFPPEHNAGSETTVHAALRAMVERGHQVSVICDRSKTAPYEVDGIKVVRPPRRGVYTWLREYIKDADLVVTHLDLTSQAMTLCVGYKPLVHFVHNSAQLKYWNVNTVKCQLAVFNSHWVAEAEQWTGPQVVIHPVVEPERYKCERGESITLVNPTSGKGAKTFYDLAQMMPDRQFLTAQGGYGIQMPCPKEVHPGSRIHHRFYDDEGNEKECFGLPNVTHIKNDPDIRNVLRRTKVLLMPSDYESFGRVGIEAACAGIPTIAHPTPGLKEAFEDAAIFCDRNDVKEWFLEVNRLFSDEVYYRKRSSMALELAASLDPESEFDRLEKALLVTSADWKKRDEVKAVKMWRPDVRLWETSEGKLVREIAGRIPQNAVRQWGLDPIPEEVAIRNGLIPDPNQPQEEVKAIDEPQENKAIESPAENKSIEPKRRGRKPKAA